MQRQCILFCFFALWLTTAEGMQFRFDYAYSKEAGGWLKLHRIPATFAQAFLRCKAEGALLASPLSLELRKAMSLLFKSQSDSCAIFTGIHATFSKGDFASVEGVPLSKIPVNWGPDEPDNNGGVEDCTVMLQNGTIGDVRCNETYPYICYKKKTESPVFSACGTVDKEYNYEPRTGSCYKFHTIGRNWRRAYMTCMAEGGYLAIINSAVEAQVIKEIYAKFSSATIMAQFKEQAAIGTYASVDHGLWFTIHGETLAEAGYSSFSGGQPDNNKNYDGGSNCGGVLRNSLLDDIWCDSVTFPFICEKKPDSLVIDEDAR